MNCQSKRLRQRRFEFGKAASQLDDVDAVHLGDMRTDIPRVGEPADKEISIRDVVKILFDVRESENDAVPGRHIPWS